MTTSSIRHRTPGSPSSNRFILRWNNSGALEMPNGSLLKQYLPNGVMNVVRYFDSSASGICQKPLFASSLLNSVAPDSCAKVSSTLGIGWVSRNTHSFKGFRSMQIRMSPDRLGTTTIPAHQGVYWVTFEMMPVASILCSSVRTFSRSGIATFLGVNSEYGWASSYNRMW